MALQDMTPADLAAVMKNDGDGFGNGNGWWIILLFLFLGWGNYGFGGGNVAADNMYPWLNSAETVMNGFSNIQNTLAAGFANAETGATNRQLADMQQMFALQSQLSQCCCENRLATANLQAALASEACADRAAVSDGVRDILANQNAGIQRILDRMCDQDLYAERRENEQLRQQLAMASLAASQTAQTAELISALKTTTTA